MPAPWLSPCGAFLFTRKFCSAWSLGALVGGALNRFSARALPIWSFVIDQITNPIGTLFLRLLLLLVVPLVFSSLVVGVAGSGRSAAHRPHRREVARLHAHHFGHQRRHRTDAGEHDQARQTHRSRESARNWPNVTSADAEKSVESAIGGANRPTRRCSSSSRRSYRRTSSIRSAARRRTCSA